MELTIISIIELIKYTLAFRVFFQKSLKIKLPCLIIYFTAAAALQEITAHFYGSSRTFHIILLTGLMIPAFFTKGRLMYNILEYALLAFGVSITDIFADCMLCALFPAVKNHNFISLFSLVLLSIFCLRRNRTKNSIQLLPNQYALLFLGLSGSIALLTYFRITLAEHTPSQNACSHWYMAAACVCAAYIMVTSICQIHALSKADNYRRQTQAYEMYMKLQEQQINAVIQNDRQQRALRHDMQAHFWAVSELAKEQNFAALETYLNRLQEQPGFFGVQRYTNNTAVDAVIAHIMQAADTASICLHWHGKIPPDSTIEIFDWCVLISNLLTNALEACRQIETDTAVDVRLYAYYQSICLKIQNPVKQDIFITDNALPTTKKDKSNHGYGSDHVKRIVEKYHGSVHYSCEKLIFTADLFMRNP